MIASRVASYFFHVYYKALTNAFRPADQQDNNNSNSDIPLQKLTEFYGSESTAAFARDEARQQNAVGATSIVNALKDLLEGCQAGSVADFKVEVEKAYFVRSRSGSVVASTEGFFLFPNAEIPFNQTFHLVPTSHRTDTYYISAECLHVHPVKKCAGSAVDQKQEEFVAAAQQPTPAAAAAAPQQQQQQAAAAPAPAAVEQQQQQQQQKPKPKKSLKDAMNAPIPDPKPVQAATATTTEQPGAASNNNNNKERRERGDKRREQQAVAAPAAVNEDQPQQQQKKERQPRGKKAAAEQQQQTAAATTERAERPQRNNNNKEKKEQQKEQQQPAATTAAPPVRNYRQAIAASAEKPVEQPATAVVAEQKPRPKRENNNNNNKPRTNQAAAAAAAENGVEQKQQQQSRQQGPSSYAQIDGLTNAVNYASIRRTLESMGHSVGKIVFMNGKKSAAIEFRSAADRDKLAARGAFILGEDLSVTAKKFTKEEFDKLEASRPAPKPKQAAAAKQ